MEYTTYENKHINDGKYLGTCGGYDYYIQNGDILRLYTETTFKGSDIVKTYSGDIVSDFINAFDDDNLTYDELYDTLQFLDESSAYEIY